MRLRTYTLCALTLFLLASSALPAEAPEEFLVANRFYEEKDFASAIRLYESVLNQGLESSALYFNLGNAYFKNGDLGYAVLYYMKARRLSPDDADIRQNLRFARQYSRVQMEGVQLNPINTFFSSIVDSYRLSFMAWVSSLLFVLLMLILIVRFGVGMNNSAIRAGIILVLLLVVVTSGLTTFKYRRDYLARRAVIVSEESPVLTGPSPQSDVELEGAPGLIVEILDQTGDYYHVLFENKRRGWINRDLVAVI
ncbi:MAG: tetratricopeptide repeat protein [Candidatus Zixiibacteriota bacterium]|nr:MAG: tetratricopeptide repeat protein [candidate division Zixibacteria bacterium]